VNVFAFGSGLYDSALPQLSAGTSEYGSAVGFDVGGGVSLQHALKDGTFSLSYKGDYHRYAVSTYANGINQNLSLLFSKRLSRQWSVVMQGSGGVISYGGQVYNESPASGTSVLTNPLSSQSRFATGGITVTYQQTRRLSYSFGGEGFLNNYNYRGAVDSFGASGTASINYRTTARTTIGATYTRTYFTYAGSTGTTNIDSGFLNLHHTFNSRWSGSLSGGVSHVHTQGVITEPVTLLLDQQLVTGYLVGPYNHTSLSPSFQGSITRNLHHAFLLISGGQGVNAGNGTLLTSKSQYGGVTFSATHHLTNFSFGGGFNRLTSIANTVSNQYTAANASVSYGFNIVRYLSANFSYNFTHYDTLYSLKGVNESRITFGLSFSSKSIPLTLF
jgi:hypothetical protein